MDRRTFLKTGLVATAAATTFKGSFFRPATASHPSLVAAEGPYGPLGLPDALGIQLPAGFSSRLIARSGELVPGTVHPWHIFPDGGATFATPDGGWIYVCNSEVPGAGGVGAVRFDAGGSIVDAYPILVGSSTNCSGGSTPWGTWLSCEETQNGQVWECDPTGLQPALPRSAMGWFDHEAAAVDPVLGHVYLTEDHSSGALYRFTPVTPGDLSAGALQIARVSSEGMVDWLAVPNPNPVPSVHTPTRNQVTGITRFDGGEGIWFDEPSRLVYFTTKGDNRVWELDVDASSLRVLHDRLEVAGSPLSGVDNITVTRSGDIFICEDGGNLEIVLITPEGTISPFVHLTGQSSTEIAGVAFDPSGGRMYFSSQRASRIGMTYEVSGPFRIDRPA